MKKLLLTTTIVACSLCAAFAGDGKSFKETKNVVVADTCRFRDTEFQVDAFYTGFFGGKNTYFSTGSGGGFGGGSGGGGFGGRSDEGRHS